MKRPGQSMQLYSLTPIGLCVGLDSSDELWDKMEVVIEKLSSLLPSIFERWKLFKEVGLSKEFKAALRKSIEYVAMDWSFEHKLDEDFTRWSIEQSFLKHFINVTLPPEALKKWNKIIRIDNELMQMQRTYHKKQVVISKAIFDQQRKKLEIDKILSKPNPNLKKIEELITESTMPHIYISEL